MDVQFISDDRESVFGAGAPAAFLVEYVQGCAIVAAAGEIDLCAAPALHAALTEAAESADRIVIDLTRVTFLNSTGVTVMVDALNQHHHRQRGTLCLVGPSRAVHKVMDVTHMTSQFPIYPSLREAIAELA